ncbi:hypothetical protein Vafri_8616 [Volvox africanus]|uniref:Uncharacterized protein n=1 Tax=Volvox africanus TaxID=51714 RepID=A0A8J4B2M0_9CHLO|nr:hypothetical protein Vafri_8616 [Volvox africanus]
MLDSACQSKAESTWRGYCKGVFIKIGRVDGTVRPVRLLEDLLVAGQYKQAPKTQRQADNNEQAIEDEGPLLRLVNERASPGLCGPTAYHPRNVVLFFISHPPGSLLNGWFAGGFWNQRFSSGGRNRAGAEWRNSSGRQKTGPLGE